jgi:hypothetical protein
MSDVTAAIPKNEAYRIAKDHVARTHIGHPDYRLAFDLYGYVGEEWLFGYSIECLKDVAPENQEQFAGAGGFLVSVDGRARDLPVPEFIKVAGTVNRHIIGCTEETTGAKPRPLRHWGRDRLKLRCIKSWMDHFGSYGMGGPGFFELYLEKSDRYPAEHLVLTLWGASNWLLLNNLWITAHPNQYEKQRPLYSNYPDQRWDEATMILVGSVIADTTIDDTRTIFALEKDGLHHPL